MDSAYVFENFDYSILEHFLSNTFEIAAYHSQAAHQAPISTRQFCSCSDESKKWMRKQNISVVGSESFPSLSHEHVRLAYRPEFPHADGTNI